MDDSVHEDFVGAARQGQGITRLEYLLSRGANVDARDESGLTALYHAAFRGDSKNVQGLLQHGADVNSGHHLLGTPIAVAALRGHLEVVETLLLFKADIIRILQGLGSALHCACFRGNTEIFNSILHVASQYDYFAGNRSINLKAFSIILATDRKSSGIIRLLMKEFLVNFQGPSLRCSPIFLAAERCNFDILHLRCATFHHDCSLTGLWKFTDRDEQAANGERLRKQTKASLASVECRSGPSIVSNRSTSSAWSTLGFPLAAREQPRSTLLMWAAASLNLPLISHLLGIGASANAMDEFGRTALHYAAEPLLEATFKDIEECVRLLLVAQVSSPSIQIPPVRSVLSPLELVIGEDHAALDPRTSFKWGLDIHRTCISSFLDPLETDEERSELAQTALLHALSHNMCPADSIKLLCKHAVRSGQNVDLRSESDVMDHALYLALMNSAAEPIILILLDHGASPNAESYMLPLIMAMNPNFHAKVSEAVVIALLQHDANPHLRPRGRKGPPMTPHEYAKHWNLQDMIDIFTNHATILKLTDPASIRSAEPVAKVSSRESPRGSRSLDVSTGSDGADEPNELNDLDDDLMYEVDDRPRDEPRGCVDKSRPWFLGIPAFSLPQLRKNSKQK